jgi:hypothetical protein
MMHVAGPYERYPREFLGVKEGIDFLTLDNWRK